MALEDRRAGAVCLEGASVAHCLTYVAADRALGSWRLRRHSIASPAAERGRKVATSLHATSGTGMTSIESLFRDLISAAPGLEAVRKEHLADNNELLPHVLFGNITQWVVERGPTREVLDVLHVLERHIATGDEAVQEVLVLSFLYNLVGDDPGERAIRAAFGPRLRAEFDSLLDALRSGRPRDLGAAT